MKPTSEKLEMQEKSAFRMHLFVGGSFLVFGLFSGSLLNLFTIIGLLVVIFAQIETVTFDKDLGYLIFKHQQPFICKTKIIKHLLQDISGVEIQKLEDSESIKYRVCLVLFSGKRCVPLTSYFSTGFSDKQKTAQVIATFLNTKNYGLDGFPRQPNLSEEMQWETVEEEIVHWESATATDSNDADARVKLAFALLRQDEIKNKEQAIACLKQAENVLESQGYHEDAMYVAQIWRAIWWRLLKT
ncbi:M48 family metallopeptidase [Tychonema sp. LEGE 07203]|uniref:tetratricopeptide repeat protein n=1 Tax=Tychonema sp. LEGE 07203 TaxID=1828671 RepID=UPI001880FE5A|nr:hypothetical protein [Tychonema sp. LEGE 07203]MBE9094786.1 hypothetical protein [Tychonema sp. LEGE 07203]